MDQIKNHVYNLNLIDNINFECSLHVIPNMYILYCTIFCIFLFCHIPVYNIIQIDSGYVTKTDTLYYQLYRNNSLVFGKKGFLIIFKINFVHIIVNIFLN